MIDDDLDDDFDENTTEPETVEEEAEQKKAAEYWEKLLRLQAEIQNLERRSARELQQAHRFSIEKLAKELLQVIDSLEQALGTHMSADQPSLTEGVKLTLDLLYSILGRHAITKIDALNQKFNPELHEAMVMQESDGEAGIVLQVIQHGFLLHDRVLRPARVIVSKAK